MITDPDIQFVIKKPICDGIGNVIKSFITAYSVNANSKIDCNSDYLLGVYDTVLDERHIYKENPNITPKYMYTSRLLVLPEEENEQQHIFSAENYEVNGCGNNDYNYLYSFQRLIDYNYDPDRICERVKKRIIGAIEKIKFLPFIENKVLENIKNISENSLAISIRTWKCFHETNINREYNSEVYKEKIRDVILALNPDKILISFDNHDYEEEYISFLYEEFAMQIFGHSPSSEMSTFQILNETYNKYKDKVDFVLISKQVGKTKPATLFFVSKFGCEIDKVVFYNNLNKDKIWDEFDVLLTANPDLLKEDKNKTTIKFETTYNLTNNNELVITSIKELEDKIENLLK